MILEIQHETRLEYAAPVTEDFTEVRMEPRSDADQSCRTFHLKVSPPAEVPSFRDGFGNRVHHFNLLAPHAHVTVLAASVIETHPQIAEPRAGPGLYPVDPAAVPIDAVGFLAFRGPVRQTPLLDPVLDALRPSPEENLGRLVGRVSAFIKAKFEYAPDVTHASSPVDDVLRQGKGVCQDFAHLMIAVLRSFGVPARYVSGYIHRPGQESQSHAWAEAWLPEVGWVAMDPTHDRLLTDDLVKVAIGRDFTDVPPNKGVYRGNAAQTISVRVETRTLDRLPPLSWQEQLPPLRVPLRAIVPRRPAAGPTLADFEQQQQQ
jgi:transglutaminase-like putative cysteine protease